MRSRRLVRDYETLPATSESMVLWSMTMLMSRRLARRTHTATTAMSSDTETEPFAAEG